MINALKRFNTENLFVASTELFNQLGISLKTATSQPVSFREIIGDSLSKNKVLDLIQETYFIGIIENSVFNHRSKKITLSESKIKMDEEYEGLYIVALSLSRQPSSSEISELTRIFNRASKKMPVALLLKYKVDDNIYISISISERFRYLQN